MFIGTFENKIDRKGRVSVPYPFRQALGAQPSGGIVAFKSFRANAIEACGHDFLERINETLLEKMNESMATMNAFSADQDDMATNVFGGSHSLPFDGEGRVILPAEVTEYAGITDRAAFVGKGPIFQIWEPEALRQHMEQARARAKAGAGERTPRAPGGGTS